MLQYSKNRISDVYCQTSFARYEKTFEIIYPYLSNNSPLRILDFGTAEGFMALTIKKHFPQHEVVAGDTFILQRVQQKLTKASIRVMENLKIEPKSGFLLTTTHLM